LKSNLELRLDEIECLKENRDEQVIYSIEILEWNRILFLIWCP